MRTDVLPVSDLASLRAGFADPVHAAQAVFRLVLEALSRPGRVQTLALEVDLPPGLGLARGAAMLALADYETPLWLPEALRAGEAGQYLRFHCGAPLASAMRDAHFVLIEGLPGLPALDELACGDAAYPDRAATLLVEVPELAEGGPIRLTGPGIEREQAISVAGWSARTTAFFAHNRAGFPLGVDVLLCCGAQVLGLPRSVRIEV